MPSVAVGHTVAEQIAALPPLSQLLGIDDNDHASADADVQKPKRRAKAGTSAPRIPTAAPVKSRTVRTEATTTTTAATTAQATNLPALNSTASPTSQFPLAVPSTDVANLPAAESVAAAASTPPSPAAPTSPTCLPGGLREWRHVQSTLQLPLAYRSEDDISVTLRLLRSLPFFAPLLDHDLLTLAETMSLEEVAEAGTVVLRKQIRFRPPAGSPGATLASPTPSTAFASGASMLAEDDDDEDAVATARPRWMIPAAELFHHFRAQMAHGDQPSLPAACVEGDSMSPAVDGAPAGRTASQSRVSSAHDAHVADELKTPLFRVPDGWQDDDDAAGSDEEPFVVVLLSGHCELRWPRQRGPAEPLTAPRYNSYKVQPGDAMGYALVWNALPAGARYVTSDTCTLLKVAADGHPRDIRERLIRACRRANDAVYKTQRTFLSEQLRVPIFTTASAAGGGAAAATAENSSDGDPTRCSLRLSVLPTEPTAREAGAVAVDTLLDLAAQQLIPVRVPNETVLLQEGLSPATECGLFFVAEGSCSVVRRLWTQDQQRFEARKAQLVKELTPPNGVRPVLSSMPSTASMEVAQLRPGDLCGDLAYLRVDPDNVTSVDAEWTSEYWQNTFLPAPSEGGEKGEEEGQAASSAASQRGPRLKARSTAGSTVKPAESKSLFRRHKSTVVTQRTSQLYVLLPSAAAQVIRGVVLDRMLENAAACPGYATLLLEYEKLFKWAIYKEKVLCEESKKTHTNLR